MDGRGKDPYMLSFKLLMERIMFHAGEDTFLLFPEIRSPILDRKLEGELLLLKRFGIQGYSGIDIEKQCYGMSFTHKNNNLSGSQLVDMLVSPIGRYCIGKKSKGVGNAIPIALIQKKIPLGDFIVFP